MTLMELVLTGIALSMDAVAVSLGYGMTCPHIPVKKALKVGVFFGGFQALMPALGWLLGSSVRAYIVSFDHWIAFALLMFIGGKMIWDGFHGEQDDANGEDPTRTGKLLVMAVATSIDALAVGVSLALTNVSIGYAAGVIGLVTLILCVLSVYIGKRVGSLLRKHAVFLGGIILIAVGLKILVDHLFFGA